MRDWLNRHGVSTTLGVLITIVCASHALAEQEPSSVDKARDALTQGDGDADSTQQLEEVFQAAEKNYSLLKKGKKSLTYAFDYTYFGDQRLDIDIVNGTPRNFDVQPSAQHTFTNSFSIDFGVLDNLTMSLRVPFVAKYDTQDERANTDWGDASVTARWQPFAYVPGEASYTLFGSFKSKTGTSPYDIDISRQLSTGAGYYSFSGGVSWSKVLDPVVVFSSLSLAYGVNETDLNQVRGSLILSEVEPANSYSLSTGFSYALSYDVSLSISSQFSYSDETVLKLRGAGTGTVSLTAEDQVSALMSFALGVRVTESKIINTSVGFGLTEESPDVLLGISIPINIDGLKDAE